MRQLAMQSRMLYARPIPVGRIVQSIADRKALLHKSHPSSNTCLLLMRTGAQANTQQYGKRPYGVGFLVIGKDVR